MSPQTLALKIVELSKIAAVSLGLAVLWMPSAVRAQDAGQQTVLMSDGTQQTVEGTAAADGAPGPGTNDPPSQVGRISVLAGTVSYEPASVNEFSPAETNYPLTTGDRLYTDVGSNAEIQNGNLAVRMGVQTDLTVTAMTDTLAQFGLGQGSVHLRSFSLDPNATVELDTPNVAVTLLQPGDVRIDVDPSSDSTIVSVVSGQVEVDGNGLQQQMQTGERVRLIGADPVAAQWLRATPQDALDQFSAGRDSVYANAADSESGYLNSATIGGEDLTQYGQWQSDPDDGAVWYPSGVAVGWEPYRFGHWVWIAPWGWTWVESEPWGFAPFHYGRWARFGDRWGWVPGPPVVRPVWSPALVVFVGAPGVTAWFPLGPREPFVPWYHASTLYVNRVNVSNIYNRNTVQVRSVYNQRATNQFAGDAASRVYVNRQVATVAMPQGSFAAGRPVAQNALRGPQPQLETAQIVPHPLVTPERSMVVPAAARAVPPQQARPTLASHVEQGPRPVSGGPTGNPAPQPPAVSNEPAPISRPVPVQRPSAGSLIGGAPERAPGEGIARAPVSAAQAPAQEPNPVRGTERSPVQPVAEPQPARPQPEPQPAPRPLFNRAVPPEPRPSFEQQRQAIETTDPGRPLSPQQLNNLRQSQPAGPAQQHETPHPPPAPRPAPPPAPNKR